MESMDGEWESSEQDMLGDDRDGRDELATEDEDEDYEEPDEEEDETDNADEDQDYDAESCTCSTTSNAMEIDNTLAIVPTPGPSATLAHHASQLPSHYALARGSSSTGAPSGFEEFAFDVDPENIRLLGLILMLVIKDRDDMEANVLAYARGRGWSDEDIGEMVREAFLPKRIVPPQPQGPIGGDLTLSEFCSFFGFKWETLLMRCRIEEAWRLNGVCYAMLCSCGFCCGGPHSLPL